MPLTLETWSPRSGAKTSKYAHVADQLRRQITKGVLRPGDRLPSFGEMRSQHDLTNITTERVYSILENEGLVVRQPSRGTFVARRDEAIETSRASSTPEPVRQHQTVGVSGLGFTFAGYSSYWARVLQGMRETTARKEAQLLLLDHNSFAGWEKADGVLLCDYVADEVLSALPESMPRVALVTPLPGMPSVVADDYRGGRIATEHLLELGHKGIAYLHLAGSSPLSRREAGYRDALQAAGIEPRAEWIRALLRTREHDMDYGSDFVRAGRASMTAWLQNGWRKLGCTAIFAHNDEVTVGVIEALREAKIRVPQDVSVIGYDGVEIGEYSSPRLTTIEVPLREIGDAGAELLMQQMKRDEASSDEAGYERHILPVRLQVRESTTSPAAGRTKSPKS